MALKTEMRSERKCTGCKGPDTTTAPVVRYYGNGKSKFFHPVCVGSWLMSNPDDSLCFEMGEVSPEEGIEA